VAILTFFAVSTFVLIIVFVAAETARLQLILIQIARMATVTVHLSMLTRQAVFRVTVMIKLNLVPVLFFMTGLAFLSIPAAVNIIQAMTTHTLPGGILEPIPHVTKLTIDVLVFTTQGEVINRIMIKARLLPALFNMTGFALLAQFSLMYILLFVTTNTSRRSLAILFIQLMTGLAIQNSMPMLKLKIRIVVIE